MVASLHVRSRRIDERNLLLRNMVYTGFLFEFAGSLEKVCCVEVVAHVASRKEELSIFTLTCARHIVHLRVLNHLINICVAQGEERMP